MKPRLSPKSELVSLRRELRRAIAARDLAFERRQHTALGAADKLAVHGEVRESFLAIYREQRDEHMQLHERVETLHQAIREAGA